MLRIEQFSYVRSSDLLAVVTVQAGLGLAQTPPTSAALMVTFDRYQTASPARSWNLTAGRPLRFEHRWSASFWLALELVEHPLAGFELSLPGQEPVRLPLPELHALVSPSERQARSRRLRASYSPRRLVAMAGVIVVTVGSTPGVSLAATSSPSAASTTASKNSAKRAAAALADAAATSTAITTADANASRTSTPPRALTTPPSGSATKPKHAGSRATSSEPSGGAPVAGPVAAQHAGTSPRHAGTSPRHTGAPPHQAGTSPHHAGASPHHAGASPHHAGASPHHAGASPRHAAPHTGTPRHTVSGGSPAPVSQPPVPLATTNPLPPPNPAFVAALGRLSTMFANDDQPPSFLVPIYKAAARRYHVPWEILAAINLVETDYGRNMNTSTAGAVGWMQFMPATWREWGTAVGHHGAPDPYDPRDAIFSAARYLAASGAEHDLRQAIFAYNHAAWYVDEVTLLAAKIRAGAVAPSASAQPKLKLMLDMAHLLNHEPYVWGGGHGGWELVRGYDCSGFVSAVLHAAGYLSAPVTTQSLPSQPDILPGPGRWVTIFDRTDAGLGDDHVIIDINGQWWESGGSSSAGGAAGVHRIADISPAYLATFNEILHPSGL